MQVRLYWRTPVAKAILRCQPPLRGERDFSSMNRTRSAAMGLALALFLTGASGLVYQVLWSRYLGLLLGSSAVAIVVVLAAFMGGLAIGSWVFGKVADRPISRLTLYGWLELSIGLYCGLYPRIQAALSDRLLPALPCRDDRPDDGHGRLARDATAPSRWRASCS